MGTTTVRVSKKAHDVLRQISEDKNISMIEAVEILTSEWEKQQFFRSLSESFAALRANPDAWEEESEERRLWESTSNDNLDESEDS